MPRAESRESSGVAAFGFFCGANLERKELHRRNPIVRSATAVTGTRKSERAKTLRSEAGNRQNLCHLLAAELTETFPREVFRQLRNYLPRRAPTKPAGAVFSARPASIAAAFSRDCFA